MDVHVAYLKIEGAQLEHIDDTYIWAGSRGAFEIFETYKNYLDMSSSKWKAKHNFQKNNQPESLPIIFGDSSLIGRRERVADVTSSEVSR